MGEVRIRGGETTDKIAEDLRVLHVEQALERGTMTRRRTRVFEFQVLRQHLVEFAHAAPAVPAQPGAGRRVRVRGRAQCCRSAIIILISAIARAGFRSFGHASVQFMIVWQR